MGEAKRRREHGEGPRQIKVQKPSADALRSGKVDVRVEFFDTKDPAPGEVVTVACPVIDGKRGEFSYAYKRPLSPEEKVQVANAILHQVKEQLERSGVPIESMSQVDVDAVAKELAADAAGL